MAVTTVVARTIFALRKALKSSKDLSGFLGTADQPGEIDRHLPRQGSLKAKLKERLGAKESPYVGEGGRLRNLNELPAVNIVIEDDGLVSSGSLDPLQAPPPAAFGTFSVMTPTLPGRTKKKRLRGRCATRTERCSTDV